MSIYENVSIDVTIAAGSTDERYVSIPFEGKWYIDAIFFMPSTAVALNGTNYLTSTISVGDGAAGSYTAIGSHDTNTTGTALVLNTKVELSFTASAAVNAAREVQEGYSIRIAKTEASAGAALDGNYQIRLRRIG